MSTTSLQPDLLEKPLVSLPKSKLCFYMVILYLLFASDLWARVGINALLPLIQKDFLLSDTQVGMLGSAVLVGMMVFVLPASYMADKWSKRGTICIMGLTWSIGTMLCGMASGFGMLLMGRFMVGGGNSSYAPASVATITDWFPKKTWGRVISLYNTSIYLGMYGGLMITGILATYFGWKVTFAIIGASSIILALMALFIPDRVNDATTKKTICIKSTIQIVVKNKTLTFVSLATACFNATTVAVNTFCTIFFMREMSMTVAEGASLLGAIGMVGGFIGAPVGGFLLDAWYKKDARSRGWFPALCLSAAAVLMASGFYFHSVSLMIIGKFIVSLMPVAYHTTTQEVVPLQYKASSYGAMVIFLQLGGVIGATLAGFLSESFGIQSALILMHLGYALSAVFFLISSFFYRSDFSRARLLETVTTAS